MKLKKKIKRSKMFRKLFSNKKNTAIVIGVFLGISCFFGFGYALVSSDLSLSGTVQITNKMEVIITNIEGPTSNGGIETSAPTFDKNNSIIKIDLPSLSSTISYDITLKNNGNVNALYKDVIEEINNNSNIEYKITNLPKTTILKPNEIITFTITYSYKSSVNSLPSNTSSSTSLTYNFEETTLEEIKTDSISKEGLLFYVDSLDGAKDGIWKDRTENGNDVTLNNVLYKKDSNSFYFSGENSCGTTGKHLIPSTGDFTLEILVELNAKLSDAAILSQKVMSSTSETGRFKVNTITSAPNLRVFWNQTVNTTGTVLISNTYNLNELYHIQIVREGNSMKSYLNNTLTNTFNISSSQVISQQGTVQLGCWNGIGSQNMNGSIYTARIYDRALSFTELKNNYDADLSERNNTEDMPKNLKQYIIENDLTTTGSGLYYDANNETYVYKGASVANNIKIGSDLWRIIDIDENGNMGIYKTKDLTQTAFDASGNRNITASPYCTKSNTVASGSDYYGCNAPIKADNFNNDSNKLAVANDSTLVNYLKNFYDGLSSDIKGLVKEHTYSIGALNLKGTDANTALNNSKKVSWTSKVGTFTYEAIYNSCSSGMSSSTSSVFWCKNSHILTSFPTGNYFWGLNPDTNNTWDVLTIDSKSNEIVARRASRTTQDTSIYYAVPIIYINPDFNVLGNGTEISPFIKE